MKLRQIAEVIRREDEAVWVKLDSPSKACGDCKGCFRLDGKERPNEIILQLSDPSGSYQPGERVFIETDGKDMFKAIGVLYGIPFTALFVGYGVTHAIVGVDATAGLGALVAMLLGAVVSRPLARKMADRLKQPYISARACG